MRELGMRESMGKRDMHESVSIREGMGKRGHARVRHEREYG